MYILEILLETGGLDLNEDAEKEFFLTKRIHRLEDLETRDSDFSKELSIPRTPNNVRLLGRELPGYRSPFSPSSAPFNCVLTLGGIAFIDDGVLFVLSEDVLANQILIGVFGGAMKFYNDLPEDSLQVLPFDEYNFVWNLANLGALAPATEGVIVANTVWYDNPSVEKFTNEYVPLPLAEVDLGTMQVDAMGAWFYVKTIFTRILEQLPQFTFDLSFLDDSFFSRMLLELPVTQMLDNWNLINNNIMNGIVKPFETKVYYFPVYQRVLFEPIPITEDPPGLWDAVNSQWVATIAGQMQIDFSVDCYLQGAQTETLRTAAFELWQNDVLIESLRFPFGGTGDTAFKGLISKSTPAEVGDVFYLMLETPEGNSSNALRIYQFSTDYKIRLIGSNIGNFVEVSGWLPDMKQSEFVREILKLGHLVPLEQNGHVTFYKWDDIFNRKEFDLTPYLDTSKPVTRLSSIPGYGKENLFKYSDDSLIERTDSAKAIPMDSAILPDKVTKLESKFKPCDQTVAEGVGGVCCPLFPFDYEHVNDNKINVQAAAVTFDTADRHNLTPGDYIYVWDSQNLITMRRKVITIVDDFNGTVGVPWTTGQDEFDWSTIRFKKQDISLQIARRSQGAEIVRIADGGEYGEFGGFGAYFPDEYLWESIIKEYYYNFRATIYRPTVIQAWFNLPLIIFKQLQLTNPVYLGLSEAGRFYLNSLDQYKADESVRIDFVKLEDFVEAQINNEFTVTPEEPINLGTWSPGDPPLQQIYSIANTGANEISVSVNFQGAGADSYSLVESLPIIVAPGTSENATILFNGSENSGAANAQIVFNDPNAPTQIRDITAIVELGVYTVEPSGSVDLGTWYPDDPTIIQFYEVTNTGQLPLEVAFNMAPVTGWSLSTNTPLILNPGEFGTVTLQFAGLPTPGASQATINFVGTAGSGDKARTAVVLVATVRNITLTPESNTDLGAWAPGEPELFVVYTLTNTGNVSETIEQSISNDNAFTTDQPFFIPLTPGQVVPITITFYGSETGAGNYGTILTCLNPNTGQSLPRSIYAIESPVPAFTVAPTGDIDLGIHQPGSPELTQIYTIDNIGNSVLSIVLNSNTEFFVWLTSSPVSVPIDGSVQVTVRSNVDGRPPQPYTALLSFTEFGLPGVLRNIQIQEAQVRAFTLLPTAAQHLGTWIDTTLAQQYTLTNTGNVQQSFLSIMTGGRGFTVAGGDVTLLPGANAVVTVSFTGFELPAGTWQSVLDVWDTVTTTHALRDVSATVTAYASLSVTPLEYDYGDWAQGDPPIVRIFAVYNNGTVQLDIQTFLNGTHASEFEITTPHDFLLNPFTSVNAYVQYNGAWLAGGRIANYNVGASGIGVLPRPLEAFVLDFVSMECEPVGLLTIPNWDESQPPIEFEWLVTNNSNKVVSLYLTFDSDKFEPDTQLVTYQPGETKAQPGHTAFLPADLGQFNAIATFTDHFGYTFTRTIRCTVVP